MTKQLDDVEGSIDIDFRVFEKFEFAISLCKHFPKYFCHLQEMIKLLNIYNKKRKLKLFMEAKYAPICHSSRTGSFQLNDTQLNEINQPLSPINYNSVPKSGVLGSKTNKLPINLFYGVGQYNKLIITNGRKKPRESVDDIPSLEFINDHIFQHSKHHKSSRKSKKHSNEKKQQSWIKHIPKPQSKTKRKANPKRKRIVSLSNKNVSEMKRSQNCSSYLSHKTFNISELIKESLIKFEAEKKRRKMKELVQAQKNKMKNQLIKSFQDRIRTNNERYSLGKLSETNRQSLSKEKKRMLYWSSVKSYVSEALKENIKKTKPLKPTTIDCNHKPSISPDTMDYLRKKHEAQAIEKVRENEGEKRKQYKKKQQGLRKLQQRRKQIMYRCMKKKFNPTAEMIHYAFANLQ